MNVSGRLRPLPDDGSVPAMPGWRWIHTPGHSVGHISLWREADRALIAGDAIVTTSLYPRLVITGHGQPMQGPAMGQALQQLAAEFDAVALPSEGRYRDLPARAEDGTGIAHQLHRVPRCRSSSGDDRRLCRSDGERHCSQTHRSNDAASRFLMAQISAFAAVTVSVSPAA